MDLGGVIAAVSDLRYVVTFGSRDPIYRCSADAGRRMFYKHMFATHCLLKRKW